MVRDLKNMDLQLSFFALGQLLCVILALSGTVALLQEGEQRFADIPFQQETKILNKTVTCGGGTWGVFSAETYTCDDIKVDGLRLAYGYYPGMKVGKKMKCQETKGRQELSGLCRHLLKHIEKPHKDFYGVFVNNASCNYTHSQRFLFIKNTPHGHKWILMGPGHGWLTSISCMVRA